METQSATSGSRVLIVDDDPASRRLLQVRLRAMGCVVSLAGDGEQALAEAAKREPALMLLDLQMPKMSGAEVLRALTHKGVKFPIVVISAHGSIESAVAAMKEGAYDFVTKPVDPQHLEIVVRKALEKEGLKRGFELFAAERDQRYQLVGGDSKPMKDAVHTAQRAAASNATVLLLGESGTGKEVFARAIHNWSARKQQPFVAINCVGLSRELLESELFGHEKGAFTGADQLKKGKMELADGGTVFLDEIGDVAPDLQAKLLRFLQEREFDRVGGHNPIHVDLRIIAATNRDLEKALAAGQFRQDLYHRLNVIAITLPALRDRREDIPALCRHFLDRFARESKKSVTEITSEAMEKLCAYAWQGNVRELANVMERAVVLGGGSRITPGELPGRIVLPEMQVESNALTYREAMESMRRALVLRALDKSGGNRAAAAKALGLHEKYFLRLIKALGIR